jgi:hypothetical protein
VLFGNIFDEATRGLALYRGKQVSCEKVPRIYAPFSERVSEKTKAGIPEEWTMKRTIMLALFVAALSAAAYATPDLSFSAGAGAYFSYGGFLGMEGRGWERETTAAGAGGFAFFDATFAEAGIGISGGGLSGDSYDDGSYAALDLSLLGRYPFAAGPVTIFPLAGIDWKIALAVKDRDGHKESDSNIRKMSALWFQFGGGVDFSFTRNLFLRGEFLYGLRVRNEMEKDLTDSFGGEYKLGHGPTLKAAIGYKF